MRTVVIVLLDPAADAVLGLVEVFLGSQSAPGIRGACVEVSFQEYPSVRGDAVSDRLG